MEGRKLWSMPPRDTHTDSAKPRYSTSARSPSPAPFASRSGSEFNRGAETPTVKTRAGSPNVSVGVVSYGTAGTPPTQERERSDSAGYSSQGRGRSSIGLGHEVSSMNSPDFAV